MDKTAHAAYSRRRSGFRQPVAVIGMACRFPQAPNLERFWDLLVRGRSAITEVPAQRWRVSDYYDPDPAAPGKMTTKWGSFLDATDEFDAAFFGISPHEAQSMDPQQRLLLEVAWEAFEDAAIVPASIRGSLTGAFVGVSGSDYARRQLRYDNGLEKVGIYTGSGTSASIAASRLCYFFDFRGPAVAIDTACSSSSSAVHYACRSLQHGETSMALAGGVNLVLSPEGAITLSRSRMMSSDGRVKVFDKAADGFVRGEGCGVVILKRLADAIRDGNHVRAVILSSAINQSGRSNGLTAPSLQGQTAVISEALFQAGATPGDLQHVEAHGTGTALGDAIEIKSLVQALGSRSGEQRRCVVSSIKANIGHLEAASGIASLIKVILCLEHRKIPPQINLNGLQDNIDLGQVLEIPRTAIPWNSEVTAKVRVAGVNSFGFGGSNSHIVVADSPAPAGRRSKQAVAARSCHLLPLSAHSDESLKALFRNYLHFLYQHPEVSLNDICYSAALSRSSFRRRMSIVASSREDLLASISTICELDDAAFATRLQQVGPIGAKLTFVYSDRPPISRVDLRLLSLTHPVVRRALRVSRRLAKAAKDRVKRERVGSKFGAPDPQAGLSAAMHQLTAHYCWTELWMSCGIKPRAVTGLGLGQWAASAVAGRVSWQDSFRIAAEIDMGVIGRHLASDSLASVSTPDPNAPSRTKDLPIYVPAPESIAEVKVSLLSRSVLTTGTQTFVQIGFNELAATVESSYEYPNRTEAHTADPWRAWLAVLATVHDGGHSVDWKTLNAGTGGKAVRVPGVAFIRSKYWYDTPCDQVISENTVARQHTDDTVPIPSAKASDSIASKIDVYHDPEPASFSKEFITQRMLSSLSELLPPRSEPIPLDSPLLDLGLDSISIAELANSLQRTLRRPVSLGLFCKQMSLGQIVDQLCDSSLTVEHQPGPKPLPTRVQRQSLREALPLTPAQRHIWRLQGSGVQLQDSVTEVRIHGEYNIERLQHTWSALMERHDSLRLTFRERNGELMQELAESSLPVLQCQNEDKVVGKKRQSATSLSIFGGPPVSAMLLCDGKTDARLVIRAHPLVCDYASQKILFSSFSALYSRAPSSVVSLVQPGYLDFVAREEPNLYEAEQKDLPSGVWRGLDIEQEAYTFTLPGEIVDRLYSIPGITQSSLRALLVQALVHTIKECLGSSNVGALLLAEGRELVDTRRIVGMFEYLAALVDVTGRSRKSGVKGSQVRRPVWVIASFYRELQPRARHSGSTSFLLEPRPRADHSWACGDVGLEIVETAETFKCSIHASTQTLDSGQRTAVAQNWIDRLWRQAPLNRAIDDLLSTAAG